MTEQQTRPLIITRVRPQGPNVRSFELMPEDARDAHGVAFISGQVAVLRVGEEDPAYFAFAGAPADRHLEILVKRTIGASVALFDMKAGERIDLLSVVGHGFDLDSRKGRDLVFIAMGTGVAPLRSALRHVLRRKEDFGQLVVLYGARTPDDFCYRDETQGWEMSASNCVRLSRDPMDMTGPGPPAMCRRFWIMCCLI